MLFCLAALMLSSLVMRSLWVHFIKLYLLHPFNKNVNAMNDGRKIVTMHVRNEVMHLSFLYSVHRVQFRPLSILLNFPIKSY
jgi:hypothetical protein